MKKNTLRALIFLVFSTTALIAFFPDRYLTPRRSAPASVPGITRMQAETVLVESDHGSGTGVVIHRNGLTFVWTAAHVARKVSNVIIHQRYRFAGRPAGEQVFPGRVICRLGDASAPEEGISGTDAALIWVDAPPDKLVGAEWSERTSAPGETVFHVGNFYGPNFDGSVSKGVVSQVGVRPVTLTDWPWELVDQCDATCMPGSSGGPVFNARGEVIGLLVGGPDNAVSCYVPVRVIYAAAQKANVTWAIYGISCPPVAILEAGVKSAAPQVEKAPDDFIRLILGGLPPGKAPAPKAPVKPIKTPKGK